jgi:hypothetical protein
MNKPHKHAELIKQWADGAEVEYRVELGARWNTLRSPCWDSNGEYRIKPQRLECWVTHYPNYGEESRIGGGYTSKDVAEQWLQDTRGRVVHMREVVE